VKAAWVGDDGTASPLKRGDAEKKREKANSGVKSKTAGRSTSTKRKAVGRARAAR